MNKDAPFLDMVSEHGDKRGGLTSESFQNSTDHEHPSRKDVSIIRTFHFGLRFFFLSSCIYFEQWRKRLPSRLHAVSTEPDVGLNLTTLGS